MLLSRRSVGTYQETSSHSTRQGSVGQSSQLTEPLWTNPGLKSGISVHELISTSKKKKKVQAENELSNIFSKPPSQEKKSHHIYRTNNFTGCKSDARVSPKRKGGKEILITLLPHDKTKPTNQQSQFISEELDVKALLTPHGLLGTKTMTPS